MAPNEKNFYQSARETAHFTQEVAAELLMISVESLRAYESGRRPPPEHVVIAMVETYRNRWLAYQHMKQTMALAEELLPSICITDLPCAVLRVYKEVNDFMRCRDRLIEITCDGIIDAQERPEFDAIVKELDDIYGAILALKYARV